jgi:hypothetical protein
MLAELEAKVLALTGISINSLKDEAAQAVLLLLIKALQYELAKYQAPASPPSLHS